MDSAALDDLDRRIVHALQVAPRAPFSTIGRVLRVSDQTVARRYARMRETAGLRVLGIADAAASGEQQWYLRARAAPEAARAIGDALARRRDTSWVHLTRGATEIICNARTRGWTDADSLLARLPRTSRVLDLDAQCELHVYSRNADRLLAATGPLDALQIEALDPEPRPPEPEAVRIDDVDRALLDTLRHDARQGVGTLASTVGVSASSVRSRLAHLRRSGVLRFDVELAPETLGLTVLAMLWITVEPSTLHATGTALAEHPEVVFAAATTGRTNLFASVRTTDTERLYTYLADRIATLPAVREVESAMVIATLKRTAWTAPHAHGGPER